MSARSVDGAALLEASIAHRKIVLGMSMERSIPWYLRGQNVTRAKVGKCGQCKRAK